MANSFPLPHAGVSEVPASEINYPSPKEAQPLTLPAAPRKLVRPSLPVRALGDRSFNRRNGTPILAHHEAMTAAPAAQESTHAEAFYFQKQAHSQTLMVFVLEDGEHIEGYIEWYDRNAIKVRNSTRMLIYKSSIKYLYKAGENQG